MEAQTTSSFRQLWSLQALSLIHIFVRLLCAFAIAIALSVAVIFAVSEEPVTAIYNLFLGPLQSKRHFFEVFASSVPLIFTGLALGLVFKSGNFSMIADACLYTGAVVTAALAIKTSLPFAVHPIVIMIAAAAVGGLIGSIPALLKVYFHTNELVTSLTVSYTHLIKLVMIFSALY